MSGELFGLAYQNRPLFPPTERMPSHRLKRVLAESPDQKKLGLFVTYAPYHVDLVTRV